jgi:hypothetical protein
LLAIAAAYGAEAPNVTLETVARTLNVLDALSTGAKLGGGCKISAEEAKALIQPLRPLWDEKVKIPSPALWKRKEALVKKWESCSTHCLCPAYASALDAAGLPPAQGKSIRAKAAAQTEKQRLACAKKSTSLCKSSLMDYLRAESAQYQAESSH